MKRLATLLIGLGVVVAVVFAGPAALAAPIHLADSSPFHVGDHQSALEIDGYVIVALSLVSILVSIPIVRHRKRKEQASKNSQQHEQQREHARQG